MHFWSTYKLYKTAILIHFEDKEARPKLKFRSKSNMRDQTRPNTFLDQNLDHCRAHGLAYLIYIRIQLTLCLFILKLLFIETYLTRFISELVPKSQSTTPCQFIKMTPTTSSQGKMDSSNCLTNLFQWSLDNTFSWNHPWKRDSYYFNQ